MQLLTSRLDLSAVRQRHALSDRFAAVAVVCFSDRTHATRQQGVVRSDQSGGAVRPHRNVPRQEDPARLRTTPERLATLTSRAWGVDPKGSFVPAEADVWSLHCSLRMGI